MKQRIEQFSYAERKKKQHRIVAIIFTSIAVFVSLNLIMQFLIFPVRQVSVSMAPDVSSSSVIMVTPLKLKLKRGDVVLLEPRSNNELSKSKKIQNIFVKFFTANQFNLKNHNDFPGSQNELRRIIGVPGDTIYMRDYVMYIKPEGEKHFLTEFELISKKYNVNFSVAPAQWDTEIGVPGFFEEIHLGPDEYFVLGDNRKSCSDSRLWGSVEHKEIAAKALFCYFPFTKLKIY
jgi:signal peptidase I